jgi:hypothetical protein
MRRGEVPEADDFAIYRKLATREVTIDILQARRDDLGRWYRLQRRM